MVIKALILHDNRNAATIDLETYIYKPSHSIHLYTHTDNDNMLTEILVTHTLTYPSHLCRTCSPTDTNGLTTYCHTLIQDGIGGWMGGRMRTIPR